MIVAGDADRIRREADWRGDDDGDHRPGGDAGLASLGLIAIAVELGNGFLGTLVVDQGFAVCGRGD